MENKIYVNNIPMSNVINMTDMIDFSSGKVSAKQLADNEGVTLKILSVLKNGEIGGHTNSGNPLVLILEGIAEVTIDGKANLVKAGEHILIPADTVHSLKAIESFKMLLTIVKN